MFAKCRIGAVVYYVSDIARTEAFYRDVFGLEVSNMGDDGSGNDWLTATTANGIELLFFRGEAKPGSSPILVFGLDDGGIDSIVETLARKGATIVTPVSEAPGGWSAEFTDPDGFTWSLFQAEDKLR